MPEVASFKRTSIAALCCLSTLQLALSAATLEHESDASSDKNYAKAAFRCWYADEMRHANGVAVLVPGQDNDGRSMVTESAWRALAHRYGLALIGCFFKDKPHNDAFIEDYARASGGSGQALLDAISAFAADSKHPELNDAPLILWGHSAGGQFNYEFACWKPERVAAFVVNKGGVYFTHLAPESTRAVPGIFFIGENDLEFRKLSIEGVYAMNRRARALWTLAIEPKTGHEPGHTREMAMAFFDSVLPLRLSEKSNGKMLEIKEESAWIGDLKSFETRQGKMSKDEWCTWLPDENFAGKWKTFVNGEATPNDDGSSAYHYQTQTIEGWTVHINEKLLGEEKETTDKALTLLTQQLKEIVRTVPKDALAHLRTIPLWFSPEYPTARPRAEYHPDGSWLRAQGRNRAMAKGVEFTDTRSFEPEMKRMPCFVLHELSHGYHDQVLGFDQPDIIAAYKRAVASKSYDAVERRFGDPRRPNTIERAYAMTSPMEYFAECTEAFFGQNDFFPFTRDELEKHDPEMCKLLDRVWNLSAEEAKELKHKSKQ